ncbi:MAG: phosphonopyruvate decarboxylase [Patescibacteria group bacterium]|nr:phosphonopyruvate decarboxylase [Patescibacteria group bacterium]
MLKPQDLLNVLVENDFKFITGVPCSIFKSFLAVLNDQSKAKHIIAVDEGEALSIATGYHLATSKTPVVYLQNSGLGSILDPLTSLLAKEVYNIPALLLISWRGEPDKDDEPQHLKIGRLTKQFLEILDIPYVVLPNNRVEIENEIQKAKEYFRKTNLPYAIIIKKGTIEPCQIKEKTDIYHLGREESIKAIIDNLEDEQIIIAGTGKISRELFEYRKANKQNNKTDFYVIGSMGCAASIALGIALKETQKKIFILDGDGSVLMRMGTLATIGHYSPNNLYHIILDNNAHDSTGGQPTVSNTVDFSKIAEFCNYKSFKVITNKQELKNTLLNIKDMKGPVMLVVKVKKGSRKDLGRPGRNIIERKKLFMDFLNQ